jgi:hypothetical protein
MTEGPGKYDELASLVRNVADARAVIVVIIDGMLGSGFSVQSLGTDLTKEVPKLLRELADQIDEDMKNIKEEPNAPNG